MLLCRREVLVLVDQGLMEDVEGLMGWMWLSEVERKNVRLSAGGRLQAREVVAKEQAMVKFLSKKHIPSYALQRVLGWGGCGAL